MQKTLYTYIIRQLEQILYLFVLPYFCPVNVLQYLTLTMKLPARKGFDVELTGVIFYCEGPPDPVDLEPHDTNLATTTLGRFHFIFSASHVCPKEKHEESTELATAFNHLISRSACTSGSVPRWGFLGLL